MPFLGEKQKPSGVVEKIVLIAVLAVGLFGVQALFVYAEEFVAPETSQPVALDEQTQQEISEINQQIDDKQSQISELDEKIKQYEASMEQKRQEAASLHNEISLIDDSIYRAELDIQATGDALDILRLELITLEREIKARTEEMEKTKGDLGVYLRKLYEDEQTTTLEVLLTQEHFSDFLDTVQYTQNLQDQAKKTLIKVQALRDALEKQRADIATKKANTALKKQELDKKKSGLDNQRSSKDQLLDATEESEEKFQSLAKDVQEEVGSVNAIIAQLEREAKSKLAGPGGSEEEISGTGTLMWPTSQRRISAGFRDPDYPFRRWFEHNAIDIPMPKGTPLKAVDSGTIAATRFSGLKYAYIVLDMGNGLSALYGHVSSISVTVGQVVSKGEVIGESGAVPGQPGTGAFSTGAHLHLEIRKEGIPQNPLDYLP